MPDALTAPAPHVMLEDAMGHLGVVVRYGLDAITDPIDRDHIIAAHELVVALWKAQR